MNAQKVELYQAAAGAAAHVAEAESTILIILAGRHGDGIAVQTKDAELDANLPALLRDFAQQIEESEWNRHRSVGKPF